MNFNKDPPNEKSWRQRGYVTSRKKFVTGSEHNMFFGSLPINYAFSKGLDYVQTKRNSD